MTDLTLPFLRAIWPNPEGILSAFMLPSARTVCARDTDSIAAAALLHVDTENIYIRATSLMSLPEKGRGDAAASCAMPGLWADIDIKGPAHKAEDLPPDLDAALAIANCTELVPSLIVHSGNGIQAWWVFKEPVVFEDEGDIRAASELVQRWQAILLNDAKKSGYRIDPTHDLARVMRLPGTFNRKDPANPKPVTFTDSGIRHDPSDFAEIVRPVLVPSLAIAVKREFPPVSIAPIMDGCGWMRHCRDDANTLPEPEWYQMLTVVARCREAEDLAHNLSSPYPNYSHRETAEKLAHAVTDSKGPVTCTYVENSLGFAGCASCQSRARVKSPISITNAPPDQWQGVDLAAITPPVRGNRHVAARAVDEDEGDANESWTAGDPGAARRTYLSTETGNANRLVDAHGADLLFCEKRATFYIWTGKVWKLDRYIRISKLAEHVLMSAYGDAGKLREQGERDGFAKHLKDSLKRAGISNMVAISQWKLRQVEPNEFDKDPYALNFRNGTLDLRNGALRPHRREDLISKMIPYDYDAAAECPTFHRFLNRIMGHVEGGDPAANLAAARITAYLRCLLGSGATGKAEKIIGMFYGQSGNNGKSTLMGIIRDALGGDEYAGQLQIENLMETPGASGVSNTVNADLAGLQGCRFVTASEPKKGARFDVGRLRHIVGLEEIKARFLRENHFTFKPSHKLFIDCNDRPIINDPNDALWNRIKLVPFTIEIPRHEIDTTLPEKLRDELPGIMAWLAGGAAEFIKHGLPDVAEVTATTDEYRAASDRLTGFYDERCAFGPTLWVPKTALWEAYLIWEAGNGTKHTMLKTAFVDRIERLGCRDCVRENGKVRAWAGIELQT